MISSRSRAREFALPTLLAFVACLAPSIAFSQSVSGTISGTLKDSSGAVVPGAQVVLLNQDTGLSRTVQSDTEGRYLATSLPLGNYRVTASQPGFQTSIRSGIVLTVAREAVVELVLSVGAVSEAVEVKGEAVVVETTSATVSALVNQEQIRDLPLNGRSLIDLTLLTPGVFYNRTGASDPASGFGPRLSVNGARSDSNLYLLDGTVMNDQTGGAATVGGGALGVEAVREFRMLTHNYNAEYGRSSGGVVSLVTRSGTNQFHGSLYEFFRNNVLDARDFFNRGTTGKPPFRRNQFGGALGGPVVKDRVFFFVNYEGLQQRQALSYVTTVPDANVRAGVLIDPARPGQFRQVPVSPAIAPYLNNLDLWPLPNDRLFGDGTGQYIKDVSLPLTEHYSMQRMDFHLGDKDNAFLRYVYNPSERWRTRPMPNFVISDAAASHLATFGETHIFSGTALNDFRFAFNRRGSLTDTIPLVDLPSSLDFAPGEGFGVIRFDAGATSAGSSGLLTQIGSASTRQNDLISNLFQTSNTFSLIRGPHALKFGIDIQRTQQNNNNLSGTRGEYTFDSMDAILAGRPSLVEGSLRNSIPRTRGMRTTLFGWFVQDDYRVRKNLTLNLGLRHEFATDPYEVNGRSGNLNPITAATPVLGPSAKLAKMNFAPRVGLSWDPTGSGKTAIRVGAGVYHNQIVGVPNSDSPFLSSYSVTNPTFPRLPVNPPSVAKSETTSEWPLATPTAIHYTLDIQRQLTSTLSARVGYVGSYNYNMTRITQQNIRIPQILADGRKFWPNNPAPPRYNTNFSNITQMRADTVGNYNGVQASLQKSLGSGLMFGASYSFSKALSESDSTAARTIDNGGTIISLDKDDPSLDYGRSGFDQRHTFVLNSQYQLPFDRLLNLNHGVGKALLAGWTIKGIYSYGSGMPVAVRLAFNNTRSGQASSADRPNLLPGFSNNPTSGVTAGCGVIPAGEKLKTPDRWFDPCAFGLPDAGFQGNLGRYTVDGPNFIDTSFTLEKNTQLRESMNLQFRVEAFNLFNHPSFGLPQITVFSSARVHAGNEAVITSTSSRSRQIQLGLRLTF